MSEPAETGKRGGGPPPPPPPPVPPVQPSAPAPRAAPSRRIGLGCMRLSTYRTRDEAQGIAVIHAALAAGVTLLDTADSYCLDEHDAGHNERLIARALSEWSGDRARIEVATKGGFRRPGGEWLADGRARHLRAACEASLRALGVDTIDLYQLHIVDPRTSLETSVRALAALQKEGRIRRVGLSNVNVEQIERAREIVEISSVQNSLSVLDDQSLRNGVLEYCCDQGLQFLAYRPLGGARGVERVSRDGLLNEIAAQLNATPHEVALAWLLALDPCVVPIPGATRVETARSSGRALALQLSAEQREKLDQHFPAGRTLNKRRMRPPARDPAQGEVVLVMGMPGAGKSTVARTLVQQGFARLNRDERGGRLDDLIADLDAGLTAGARHWVMDNTYATRKSRSPVIECAWRHDVPVRCIWLQTSVADAQINAVSRLIETHGRLPTPEELRTLGRSDHRFFGPDAQFRYERELERPVPAEGFSAVEEYPFVRMPRPEWTRRALVLEFDDVLCVSASGAAAALTPDDVTIPEAHAARLRQYHADGWVLCALAWRPQIAQGQTTAQLVEACFARTRELLGIDIDLSFCPHPAGPPVCWCRKPLPGLVLQFAHRHQLALDRSILVGRAQADRTLAQRLSMTCLVGRPFTL